MLLKEVIHRFPPIENAEIRQMVNGPESFTPDGKILLGAVPEVWPSLTITSFHKMHLFLRNIAKIIKNH